MDTNITNTSITDKQEEHGALIGNPYTLAIQVSLRRNTNTNQINFILQLSTLNSDYEATSC